MAGRCHKFQRQNTFLFAHHAFENTPGDADDIVLAAKMAA
jgi:hypothetical protein